MKKLAILSSILILVLLTSVVLASVFDYNPTVNIKTDPNQFIVIRFKDVDSGSIFKTLSLETDSSGNLLTNLETNKDQVNVIAILIKNKSDFLQPQNIISELERGPFKTDDVITLNVRDNVFNDLREEEPEPEPDVVNDSEEVADNTEEDVIDDSEGEEETAPITGFSILRKINFKGVLYFGIGIIVIAGVLFFILMMRKKIKSNYYKEGAEPKSTPLSNLLDKRRVDEAEKKLGKAEKELGKARQELDHIRNRKSELGDAEEAFKKAKENLDRLKD